MKKYRFILTIFSAAALFSSADAVTPMLVRNVDTKACDRWVDSVYKSLNDRQRVAQLLFPKVVPTHGANSKAAIKRLVESNGVGGLLFTEGTIGQYVEMTNYAQSLSDVPLLMTFDGEWGLSMRIKGTPHFPYNMGLGAIQDPELLYDYGIEMARECRAMGIHVNFAPVLDVNSNPSNPVIGYRSFGEDPERVSALGVAYSRGLESGGVQAVGKHFPGHGDTNSDSHKTLPTVNHSRHTLEKIDLLPFNEFIKAGCSGIMTGHIALPALDQSVTPASLSRKITTGLLRDDMGFEGLIYTDALGMKGASVEGKNNCVLALQAGADVLLSSADPVNDIDAVLAAVKSGAIGKKTIEERCRKVLRYKYALGLPFEKPVDIEGMEDVLNSPEAEKVNRALAAASMTVIYNKDGILPIGDLAGNSIAVVNIGAPAENEFSDYCARYAGIDRYSTQGDPLSAAKLSKIKAHDIIVVAVYSDKQWARNVMAQLKDTDNMIAVFMVNPYKMNKFRAYLDKTKALVLAYDDTEYTREYAAQAIFGGIDVSGTLPVNLNMAEIGTGVRLKKSRLGYSMPSMQGMKASLTDSIDSLVNIAMDNGAFPGCQVLVAKDGNVVIDKCYGYITDGGKPVEFSTVYDLASVSKALGTLPGVMKAYDLGLIGLDKPAADYIPGLKGTGKDNITVRQLLYHESGMPASLNMFDLMIDTATYTGKLISSKQDRSHRIKIQEGAYGYSTAKLRTDIVSTTQSDRFPIEAAKGIYVGKETFDTIMGRIYNIPLQKNNSYNYSCLNFCLLMDMEQRITGIPHDVWAGDSIWAPLGAYTTCYRPTLKHRLDKIAPTEKDTFLRRQLVHGYVHDETANFSGGVQGNAGLFSNADDLAKICQMWLNGGEYGDKRVLSEETVRLFTTDKSPTCRRGLGFDKPDTEDLENSPTCDEAGPSVYGHLGFTGTVFWVDPDNNLIFIFLTNRVNPTRDNDAFSQSGIRPKLFQQVYKSLQ